MATLEKIIRNCYRDSLSLMQLSAQLAEMHGVSAASVVMATDGNIALLHDAGLSASEVDAGPNDLLVVIHGADPATLESVFARVEEELNRSIVQSETTGILEPSTPRSIEMSLQQMAADLALISVPGEYASAEALKALRLGLHVMLFSANVVAEDEVRLKEYARDHDLIVMGPDCGTAILNGIPLGFANVVRRGDIGLVGASGTGLQEVTTLIDRAGAGVSQAIGTGGRDLSGAVGGISTLQGLKALAEDPTTRVIAIVSKPPTPEVALRVVEEARQAGKPVVVNFLGENPASLEAPNVFPVRTLEDTAYQAVALSRGMPFEPSDKRDTPVQKAGGFAPGQRFIRGLYSGGTLASEAVLLLSERVGHVYSNTSTDPGNCLENIWASKAHTVVDLGDPLLTRGRPHPMIDHRLRGERILHEARDPEVAVILLDVVLGYGAHMNPAGAITSVIEEAGQMAQRANRPLLFVGSVCGTPADPQDSLRQRAILADAGVLLGSSNAGAVRIAAELVKGR